MVAEMVTVAPEGLHIPLDKIRDDLDQVRRDWSYDDGKQKLAELTESVREHGVLQPIEVSPRGGGLYDVLMGHRRFDAARRVGLTEIPAVVRDATGKERRILQLVENLQRQDISPIDEGDTYIDLINKYGCTKASLASDLNVHVTVVTRAVRIASNPALREAVRANLIMPHVALQLTELTDTYAAPFYTRMRQGHRVTGLDVQAAKYQQRLDGVSKSARFNTKPGQHTDIVEERVAKVTSLRAEGLSHPRIAEILGVSIWAAKFYLKIARRRASGTPDVDLFVTSRRDDLAPEKNDSPAPLVATLHPDYLLSDLHEPTTNAARSPLPQLAPDTTKNIPTTPLVVVPPARPVEVTWCNACAPFKGNADFERALVWAASHGMTAVEMLEQYRNERR